MRRREFVISVIVASFACLVSAGAQQKAMPVIGFLSGGSPGPFASFVAAFQASGISFIHALGLKVVRVHQQHPPGARCRAVNRSGGERYALAFFCDAQIDWPIAAVPTCVGPGRPPRYETTYYTDYMIRYQARTYNVFDDPAKDAAE